MPLTRELPAVVQPLPSIATSPPSLACPGLQTDSVPLRAGKRIRTLVADDDVLCRELLRRLLQKEPDIDLVALATNGTEALEAVNRLQPDLAFLDVQMPGRNGFDVATRFSGPRRPVIIFVTANEEFALQAFDVHALDYLLKPCRPARLRIALQRARAQLRK